MEGSIEGSILNRIDEIENTVKALQTQQCNRFGVSYTSEDSAYDAESITHIIEDLAGKFICFKKNNNEALFCLAEFNHILYKANKDPVAKGILDCLNEELTGKLKTIGADTYLILSAYWTDADDPDFVDNCLEIIFDLDTTAHYVICQGNEKYSFCNEKHFYDPGSNCCYSNDKKTKVQYYFHDFGGIHVYHRPAELNLRMDDDNNRLFYLEDENNVPDVFLAVPKTADIKKVIPEVDDEQVIEVELNNYINSENIYTNSENICFFKRADFKKVHANVIRLTYDQLLRFQRNFNISLLKENIEYFTYNEKETPVFVYSLEGHYTQDPIINDTLRGLLDSRQREWDLISDVTLMYPVEVRNVTRISDNVASYNPDIVSYMHFLDMRLQCETGVPYGHEGADMMERFKSRIARYYLGEVRCRITLEMIMDIWDNADLPVGSDIAVQLLVAVDKESNVGVLYVVSLSSPFLLSHLMDNVVRNQLMVIEGNKTLNLYEYILKKWGLAIAGTAKSFVTIPKNKDDIKAEELAALLMSETIYEEGEEYGKIVDSEILDIAEKQYGMAVYNYAYVGVTTNAFIQFAPMYKGSKTYRLFWNAVTAFYIELVLFEEAAINIFNKNLVQLMSEASKSEPEVFLEKNRNITVGFLNTVEFWNVQLNYQSSQKSIGLIRDAFGQQKLINRMQRYQEQVKNIFEINKELIDRKAESEEKKSNDEMNHILFILTIVSTFSALYQIIDYIMTYTIEAPGKNIFPATANLAAVIGLISIHLIRKRDVGIKKKFIFVMATIAIILLGFYPFKEDIAKFISTIGDVSSIPIYFIAVIIFLLIANFILGKKKNNKPPQRHDLDER